MEKGTELIMAITCFIVQRIIVDINGLQYICDLSQRLYAIIYVLDTMLQNKISDRIIRNILKIYLGLIENKEAKNLLKSELPQKIRDKNFIKSLEESSKAKVYFLLKSLDEDDSGNIFRIAINQKKPVVMRFFLKTKLQLFLIKLQLFLLPL